jgi:hypothetical protein
MVIFAEGMTTNGKGLIPFKKGPFDIGSPVKLFHLNYISNGFHPCLNLIHISDCIFLNFMNVKIDLEYTELEGCFTPKKMKDWQEFAEETRILMSKEFNMELYSGNIKDKIKFNETVSPLKFNM